jgi:uncharacterized protein YndB with AHSA1/START domain
MGGIRLEFELPAPPERVWPLLSDRQHLASWFTETDFVAEPGQRFMIWPGQQMAGVDGPISAVVLNITPPYKLVMGWQSPHSQTTMTWTLQDTRQGSRLRIVEWGHVGTDEVLRERTLSQLFDVGLRGLVERQVAAPVGEVESLPPIGQPGLAGPVAVVEELPAPAPAEPSDPSAAPAPSPAPPAERRRRRRWPMLLATFVVLVVLAALAVWVLWPPVPAGGGGPQISPAGRAGLGSSPATGMPPGSDPGVGPGVVAGGSGGPPIVGPIPGMTPGPSATQAGAMGTNGSGAGGAHLVVQTYQTGSSVIVSLTNNGDATGDWRAVGLVFNGPVPGSLTLQTGDVADAVHKGTYCFTPTTPTMAVVAPHTTSNFIFSVNSVNLSESLIKSVTLDSSPCV